MDLQSQTQPTSPLQIRAATNVLLDAIRKGPTEFDSILSGYQKRGILPAVMFGLQKSNPVLYKALASALPRQELQGTRTDLRNRSVWQEVIKNLPPEAIPYKRTGTPKVNVLGVERPAEDIGIE